MLERVTTRVYLTKLRRPIRSVHDALLIEIAQENTRRPAAMALQAPDYSTVRRYVRSLPKFDVDLARYGREYVRSRYRHSGTTPLTGYLLERVEVDHTPLNLFVIDEDTLLVLGRPYVTWMLDCHSRMILGFHISFAPPSVHSVLRCLRHAIAHKDYLADQYPDIRHDWPCHGVPMTLVVDNGMEFHAKDLFRVTFELGISYKFCPPRTPWLKPMVERSFRTLAEHFAHQIPGTSFANWFERYGYDPLKESIATLDELVHALHIWIADIYAQTPHRGLNLTPYAKWKSAEELVTPRDMPVERLDLVLSQQEERVLGHAGIELHGLRYNDDSLLVLRKRFGPRLPIKVRYNPDNLGAIFVLHPESGEPIPVACLAPDYADGLTLYQHKLIQKSLRTEGLKSADPILLAKAKADMQEIVGKLARSQKLSDRKRAARSRGRSSAEITKRPPKPPTEPTEDWPPPTELDRMPAAIATLNISPDDMEADHG